MKNIIAWITVHPLIVLIPLLVVIGFLALQIPTLELDFSAGMGESPEKTFYENTRDTFGGDLFTVIIVKSVNGDLFTKDALTFLATLSANIQQIEGVRRVESLTTVKHIQGGKGFVRVEALANPASLEADAISRIKQQVFGNEMWLNYLISEDGKTAGIHVYAEPTPGPSFDSAQDTSQEGNVTPPFPPQGGIVREIEEILAESASEQYTVYQIGMPAMQAAGQAFFKRNLLIFVPAALLIVCGIFLLYYRNMASFCLPLTTASLSLLATFGCMAYMEYPLTPMTVVVIPLVMAFACAESGRMMITCFDETLEGHSKADAIGYTLRHDGFPLIVTSLTIALGLSVFMISEIPLVRQFGMIAAFGVLANCLITVFIVAGLSRYFPSLKQRLKGTRQLFLLIQEGRIVHIYERYRVVTLAVIVLLMICAVVGIFKLTPETGWHEMFAQGSLLRQNAVPVSQDLAGAATLHVLIETGRENRVKEPEVLRQIDALQQFLATQPWCDTSLSLVDYLKIIEREMHGGRQELAVIPGSRELVAQYLLLLRNVNLSGYVNHDYSVANIVVRHHLYDSQALSAALNTVRNYVAMSMSSDLRVRLTGYDVLRVEAFKVVLTELFRSLALALGIMFVLLAIIFLSVKVSLVALIPALIVILFHFGGMGWLHVPLNVTTGLLAITALSLAVSNLIHFLLRYQERLMATHDQNQAIGTTIYHEGEHLFLTSAALVGGFSVLAASGVPLLRSIGFLSALMMVSLLINVFFVNPRMLDPVQIITVWDFIRFDLKQQVIQQSLLFRNLRRSEAKKIILLGNMCQVPAHDFVMRQGESGEALYMVLTGELEVYAEEDGHTRALNRVDPGGLVGEMALFGEHIRSANVLALKETTLLHINEKSLERLKIGYPRIAAQFYMNISAVMAERLKKDIAELLKEEHTRSDLLSANNSPSSRDLH